MDWRSEELDGQLGRWNLAENWDPAMVPDNADGNSYDVSVSGVFDLLDVDISPTIRTLNQNNGEIHGAGTLTIALSYNFVRGFRGGGGTTLIADGAVMTVSGSAAKAFGAGHVLDNRGLVRLSATGSFRAGEIPIVEPGQDEFGEMEIRNSGEIEIRTDLTLVGPEATLINEAAGVFEKVGTGGLAQWEPFIENLGLLRVANGRLSLTGGARLAGEVEVNGGSSRLALTGGLFSIEAGSAFDGTGGLLVDGGIVDLKTPTELDLALVWSAGTIRGGSELTLGRSGSVLGTSDAPLVLASDQSIRFSANGALEAGSLSMGDGAVLTVGSGRTVEVNDGFTVMPADGGDHASVLVEGTARHESGESEWGVFLGVNGRIQVTGGRLLLSGGSDFSGDSDTSGPGRLAFAAPGHAWNSGVSLGGTGRVEVLDGAVIAVGTGVDVTGLSLLGGVLQGGSTMTVRGDSIWEGGGFQGTGTTTVEDALVTDAFAPAALELRDGRSLEITGSWRLANAALRSGEGASIMVTGGLDLADGTVVAGSHFPGSAAVLQTGSTATVTVAGSVNLDLDVGVGGSWALQAADLHFGGSASVSGDLLLDGTIEAAAGFQVTAAGLLRGSGGLAGALEVSGTLAPGSDGGGTGTIAVTGDVILLDGSRTEIDLRDRPEAADFDRVTVSGSAVLAGDLVVTVSPEAGIRAGDRFTVVSATNRIGSFDTLELLGETGGLEARLEESAGGVEIVFDAGFTYADWIALFFTDEEIAAGTLTAPTADPDHDGVANLAEYVLVTLPRVPDNRGWVRVLPSGAVGLRRRAGLVDASIALLAGSSPGTGTEIEVIETTVSTGDGFDEIELLPTDPGTTGRRFYRVRFQLVD